MTSAITHLPRIVKLDPAVINRIAAGEIIQRPANALKELVENSIDAGATAIDIVVDGGGMKLLQISDNGSGILLADLPILCERFTTSKLREFRDLESMSTYGFRGEALASITHVSRLSVTTKTLQSLCAYKAHYCDGNLISGMRGGTAEPRPVAGNQGTMFSIEDLFYNVPSRRRALSKPGEEYAKIIDVVNKKSGDSLTSLSTTSKNTTIDNIRLIYGSTIANELLPFEKHHDSKHFSIQGLVTGANYRAKKFNCILFVNGRLVESSTIKKHIETTHSNILAKGDHPFVYISIRVEPSRVDVNVHPTKREVQLLDEELIITTLSAVLLERLAAIDTARVFLTQTLLPSSMLDAGLTSEKIRRVLDPSKGAQSPTSFVRTDSKQSKLISILDSSRRSSILPSSENENITNETLNGKERVCIKLASVKELRAEIRATVHEDLTAIFTEHVFVGIVDLRSRLCVIQYLTKLYLVDYGAVSAELFYQIGLSEFGNFGTIILKPALDLKALLSIAATEQSRKIPKETVDQSNLQPATDIQTIFLETMNRREMLKEYFALGISSDGKLETLPLLLKQYNPAISKLPAFLLRMGQNVDWKSEKKCFQSFLSELALYYIPEVYETLNTHTSTAAASVHETNTKQSSIDTEREAALRSTIENILFPACKRRLIATKKLAEDNRVMQIGELNQLYRTFERC